MSSLQILIVEDEAIIARDVERMLNRLGHHVVDVAVSGEEALQKATELHPDLILMDIRLQGPMDGIQAAKLIASTLDLPVVFLTAHTDDRTLHLARDAGPYGFIVKPCLDHDLRVGLDLGLYHYRARKFLAASEGWLRNVLRSMADAVLVTDAEGHIRHANPAAVELLGLTPERILGHAGDEVFVACDASGTRLPNWSLHQLMQGQTAADHPNIQFVSTPERPLPIELTASTLATENEEVAGLILVFRKSSAAASRGSTGSHDDTGESLSGLISMCCVCKSVHDSAPPMKWEPIESYIERKTDARFSHGICFNCCRILYPDMNLIDPPTDS